MARGRKESVQAKEAIATGEGSQAKLYWNLSPVMTFEQRQKKVDVTWLARWAQRVIPDRKLMREAIGMAEATLVREAWKASSW